MPERCTLAWVGGPVVCHASETSDAVFRAYDLAVMHARPGQAKTRMPGRETSTDT